MLTLTISCCGWRPRQVQSEGHCSRDNRVYEGTLLWLEGFLGFETRMVMFEVKVILITAKFSRLTWQSARHAPSLLVIPWHLPYNWGKNREKKLSQGSCKVPVGYNSVCRNDRLLRVARTSCWSAFARIVRLGTAAIQRGQGFWGQSTSKLAQKWGWGRMWGSCEWASHMRQGENV